MVAAFESAPEDEVLCYRVIATYKMSRRTELDVQSDDDGNQYMELDRPEGAKTVVTYIPYREWADQAVIRIHIKTAAGRPTYGTDIPIDQLGEFVSSIIELLNRQAQERDNQRR